jgi:hypothetical protein
MKQRGRDFVIGLLVGAVLVLLVTHHGGGSSKPNPKPTTSATPSHGAKTRSADTHRPRPGPAVTVHPTILAHPSTSRPSPLAHPASIAHLAARTAASGQSGESGLGDGVIAIASLVTIAASLSTVTMTVRGQRAS